MAGFTPYVSTAGVAATAVCCGTGGRGQHCTASLAGGTHVAPSLSHACWGWAVNQAKPNDLVLALFGFSASASEQCHPFVKTTSVGKVGAPPSEMLRDSHELLGAEAVV